MNIINKIIAYLKQVYVEMRKVTWPGRNELVGSTIVVVVISIFVALIIFVLDRIFTSVLGLVIR